ncbi:MAG: hypothetical protein IPF84_04285 [Proteobacteria bacterium]|nr:hypothetical protein [Pseudomonadota bacterium]
MRSLATLAAAAAVVLLANTPASADDTELFVGAAVAAAPSRPNILFVMDTSGSMDTNVTTQVSFNPTDTYSGSCRTDRVYWSKDNRPPNCGTDQYVAATAFTCSAAQPNLDFVRHFVRRESRALAVEPKSVGCALGRRQHQLDRVPGGCRHPWPDRCVLEKVRCRRFDQRSVVQQFRQ